MSSSGFGVIRRHSSDATGIRIKELTQELAKQRSQISGSQLETDDVRSQGRMDHSTIKINDERLKFVDLLSNDPSINYEFPTEPDFNFLKVWFMLDHLGTRMRDMSGFGNDAIIQGHPTLRRANLIMGFGSTDLAGGTPVMLFNSGTDVVSQRDGEYIWIPDNPSIQFTQFTAGFTIAFRFNCLDFRQHITADFDEWGRRFAAKTDNATNGWNLVVYTHNSEGTSGGIEFSVVHNNVTYQRRTTGYAHDTWYQVVVTYNPSAGSTAADRIKMYTAGFENSTDGLFTYILPTHTNLRIGARSAESGFFYGYIHDFRLYMGKILTQTEVNNLNANEVTIDNIPKRQVFILQHALFGITQKNTTHRYKIGGFLTATKTHRFQVTTKVTRTRTHKYNKLARVLRTKTHKYNALGKVLRTKLHKYNVGGRIIRVRFHKYNIIAKMAIPATKTHKFMILTGLATAATKIHKYNVIAMVIATKTHKYNQDGKVTTTKTHRYGIGGTVTVTKTHKFNVSAAVIYTLLYDITDSNVSDAYAAKNNTQGRYWLSGTRITSTSHPLYQKIPHRIIVNLDGRGMTTGTINYRIYATDGTTVRKTIASKTISSLGNGKTEFTFEDNTMTVSDRLELNEYLVMEVEGLTEASGNWIKIYYRNSSALANTHLFRKYVGGWIESTTYEFAAQIYEKQ